MGEAGKIRVFISHHHSPYENDFTARLEADLTAEGAHVRTDDDSVTRDAFVQIMIDAPASRQAFLVVITPDAVASPWVQREVAVALRERAARRIQQVILVFLAPTAADDIPFTWHGLDYVDATQGYEPAHFELMRLLGLSGPVLSSGVTGPLSWEHPAVKPAPRTAPLDPPQPPTPQQLWDEAPAPSVEPPTQPLPPAVEAAPEPPPTPSENTATGAPPSLWETEPPLPPIWEPELNVPPPSEPDAAAPTQSAAEPGVGPVQSPIADPEADASAEPESSQAVVATPNGDFSDATAPDGTATAAPATPAATEQPFGASAGEIAEPPTTVNSSATAGEKADRVAPSQPPLQAPPPTELPSPPYPPQPQEEPAGQFGGYDAPYPLTPMSPPAQPAHQPPSQPAPWPGGDTSGRAAPPAPRPAPPRPQPEPAATPSTPAGPAAVALERVAFTAYHPKEIERGKPAPLLVYLALDDTAALAQVAALAAERLAGRLDQYRSGIADERLTMRRGTRLRIVPTIPGFHVNPQWMDVTWDEDAQQHEFSLRADSAAAGHAAEGAVRVYQGLTLRAEIPLSIFVSQGASSGQSPSDFASAIARAYRRVFASYSHRDTPVVESCEAAAQVMGDRYLRDVITLQSGQLWNSQLMKMIAEADVFQLFWSRNAANSGYVRQEWEYALSLQANRLGFIRPVYWTPSPFAIPAALNPLHFEPLDLSALGWGPVRRFFYLIQAG